MVLTKTAKDCLGARIEGHDNTDGVVLFNGSIKTKQGIIVKPSTETYDTRSGALVDDIQNTNTISIENTDDQEPEHVLTTPRKKSKSSKKSSNTIDSDTKKMYSVTYELEGFGTLKSAYTRLIEGTGVIILGMGEYSFEPKTISYTDSGLVGKFKITHPFNKTCIYVGNKFIDENGTTNIIIITQE